MWLKSIELKNYRNYLEQVVNFNSHLNIFLGQNAQGKTNILEAIYFLALTRSHRTHHDKDLIHFAASKSTVKGTLQKKITTLPLEIELSSKGRITKVNYLKQNRLSDYIGNLNVVLFAPEDLQLVKGAPSLRRKFIDMELGQIKSIYLSDLSNYNYTLKQRNSYLKQATNVDENYLDVIDQQLVEYGTRVIKNRIDFIKDLEKWGQKKHFEISNQSEKLTITYQSTIPYSETQTIQQVFLESLLKNRRRDILKRNTSVGPHRDDINFFINGINASYGSQGQHRSLVLSIKLAEINLMEEATTETPILLLDDVMSELDNSRQLRLLETISNDIQTFVTTTSLDHLQNLPEDLSILNVDNGKISKGSVN